MSEQTQMEKNLVELPSNGSHEGKMQAGCKRKALPGKATERSKTDASSNKRKNKASSVLFHF